jgi:D-alanyl-D-alanine carboxypeptidase
MRFHLPSLCLTSLLTLASCVEPAAPVEQLAEGAATSDVFAPALPPASRAELQQTLEAIVAARATPGASVTVDHPDYRPFSSAAGVANVATGEALKPGHNFRAGSMLKTAVATAVLQLVERGRLSLDAPLTQLLPPAITSRIAEAGWITLRMLLSHTAGVPEVVDEHFSAEVLQNPTKVWTLAEYLALSAAKPRPFPPGAGWSYSNTHYILLGEIVTAASGAPWREVVKRRVFDRAGLKHSSLPRPGNAACSGCARGYELIADQLLDLTEVDPSMAEGSGGSALVTTTGDLVRFLRALLEGELFDRPGTLALMKSFVDAPLPQEAQTHYGLGLAKIHFDGMNLLGHYGSTAGYGGFMLMDTDTGVVVAGSMNVGGNLGELIIPLIQAVSRLP